MLTKIKILNNHESPYDIGKKQWDLLDELESKYESIDMSKVIHDGLFLDPIWLMVNRGNVQLIDFNRLFPNKSHYPLMLLCRVVCYQLLVVYDYAVDTVCSRLRSFVLQIVNSGQWDNIMCAERNQPFLLFSAMESDALTNIAQTRLAKNGGISNDAFDFLNNCLHLKHLAGIDVFLAGISLPWSEQEIGVNAWIDQQREVTGVIKENSFYAPMPFENVSNIVQNALPIVEDHHDELVSFFNDFNTLIASFENVHGAKTSKLCRDLVEKNKDMFSLILPVEYGKHIVSGDYTPIKSKWITSLFSLVKSACSWIILLSTGLRNIDMRYLRIGCRQPSKRYKGMWWLVADVKKTKNRLVIPVGEPTYKAVKLLESARYTSSGNILITSSKYITNDSINSRAITDDERGKIQDGSTFNDLLKLLPKIYDFSIKTIVEDDAEATAHCIRATLAGYIAENSNAAIFILKRLFGHSNPLMPNEYIYRNPLVMKRRDDLQLKLTEDMAKDMAHAVTYGEVSGRNGERLLKGAAHMKAEIEQEFRLNNQSLTEMEMFQTLEERLTQIFLDDMRNSETYALLTPMAVICNRACNNTSDSPCAAQSNNQDRISSGIKKAITDALSTLPNPAQCIGINCPDALMGKKWSRELLKSFDFYYKYRNVIDPKATIEEDAKVFVSMYATPLMAIYSDEREEGYFNVVK